MFGGGREHPRRIDQDGIDVINRWGYNLFVQDLGLNDFNIEVVDDGVELGERWVVRLIIRPHVGLNWYHYDVDIRIPNLSDLDIYNVRWVEEDYTGDNGVETTTVMKEVPIVFGTKEENT
jgi:hypothetical protein